MGLGFRAQGLNSGPWTLNLNKLQTLKSQQCSRQPFTHLDSNRNPWWDKGKIYFGEKTSQDFVMPDALPSPVFGNGYEVQKKRKSAVLTSAASTEEITVTLKSSNQKDVFCSKCLQTVQQRSKFPSPKNLLSLKYPKRGMSL
ncbi:unnamed protein product [Sphagnum jensenii]|uniref:Uncharacterized protein n=1 Tax=Sphagnum jensenii TaxID=128206 RepID=A0ABP0X1M0_9BRYO